MLYFTLKWSRRCRQQYFCFKNHLMPLTLTIDCCRFHRKFVLLVGKLISWLQERPSSVICNNSNIYRIVTKIVPTAKWSIESSQFDQYYICYFSEINVSFSKDHMTIYSSSKLKLRVQFHLPMIFFPSADTQILPC